MPPSFPWFLCRLAGINDWVDLGLVAFLPPDGNTLISGTDHEARLWRAPSWAEIAAAEKGTERKAQ